MGDDNAQLASETLPSNDIVREIIDARAVCRYKAYLKLKGQVGEKSDYERMLNEMRDNVKRVAIDKITTSYGEKHLLIGVSLNRSVLRQGFSFILDAVLDTDFGILHINGLKKVTGFSKLGDYHYIPILFHGGNRVGNVQKLVAESLGYLFMPLQGHQPNRATMYYAVECHLTTVQLSSGLSQGRKILEDLRQLRLASAAPPLILSDCCKSCEFQKRCYQQAVEAVAAAAQD